MLSHSSNKYYRIEIILTLKLKHFRNILKYRYNFFDTMINQYYVTTLK